MKNKYQKKQTEYLKVFGEHSLDNVIIPEILHDGLEGMDEFLDELDKAIKINTPIQQFSEDDFKKIIR